MSEILGTKEGCSRSDIRSAFVAKSVALFPNQKGADHSQQLKTNPDFQKLVAEFKKLTGSSFVEGQQFVCLLIDLKDAYKGANYNVSVDSTETNARTESVQIPVGAETGDEIILSNGIIALIEINGHPYFKREGNDLIYEKVVSKVESVSGSIFTIKTLDERDLVLTTGFGSPLQVDRRMYLADEGFPIKGSPDKRGTLFIQFKYTWFQTLAAPAWEMWVAMKVVYNSLYNRKELQYVPDEDSINVANQVDTAPQPPQNPN